MKRAIVLSIMLLFFTTTNFAQETETTKPFPKGGITTIIDNLIYPEEAKASGIEGKVIVKAVINEEGKVLSTEVLRSLSKQCDNAAVEAIAKTEFIPAEENGKTIKAEIIIPVSFKLK